jgi:uncharacterized protein (TIGR04255 family)
MPLNFPSKPEVRLRNAPLVEVVCQVKFPIILRIVKENPVDFQERIRQRFTGYRIEQGLSARLPAPGGQEEAATEGGTRIFRFVAPDEQTQASLAVDFYALSTRRYRHWDDFAKDLSLIHEAAQAVYEPTYATRIGLRYINRITCANASVESFDEVLDLIHPDLTALLRSEAWTAPVEMVSQLVIPDDGGRLAIRHGIGEEESERFFALDYDYFETGQLPLEGLLARLERYHQVIYDAFRWSLGDRSLARFEPIEQEAD